MVLVALVLAVAVAGGGGYVLASGGEDEQGQSSRTGGSDEPSSGGGGSPEETVDAFLTASAQGDCDTVLGLLTGETLDVTRQLFDEGNVCREGEPISAYGELERSGPAAIEGDQARVPAENPDPGEASGLLAVDFLLVEDDGAWLIGDIEGAEFTPPPTIPDLP